MTSGWLIGAGVGCAVVAVFWLMPPGKTRECLEWRYTTQLVPMWIGKSMILTPRQIRLCARYADGEP